MGVLALLSDDEAATSGGSEKGRPRCGGLRVDAGRAGDHDAAVSGAGAVGVSASGGESAVVDVDGCVGGEGVVSEGGGKAVEAEGWRSGSWSWSGSGRGEGVGGGGRRGEWWSGSWGEEEYAVAVSGQGCKIKEFRVDVM